MSEVGLGGVGGEILAMRGRERGEQSVIGGQRVKGDDCDEGE